MLHPLQHPNTPAGQLEVHACEQSSWFVHNPVPFGAFPKFAPAFINIVPMISLDLAPVVYSLLDRSFSFDLE
jgi:hypothetical protein